MIASAGGLAAATRLVGLTLALAIAVSACGRANVVQRDRSPPVGSQTPALPNAASYRVIRGDTLYGIAFRHGLDYRDLARWNRIPAPYTIYPGQVLRLHPDNGRSPTAAGRPPPRAGSSSTTRPPPPARPQTAPQRPAPQRPAPQQPAPRPTPPPQTVSQPPPASNPSAPVPRPVGAIAWRWPTDGQIIGRFVSGDQTRQGLDIAGTAGQPVRASADGVVVYSGSGLVGFGELVIVKHSDEWLSAYGHNRRRLVVEGEAVKAGQTIAEMGRTGASRDMLHFEIRRNGKPVDPIPLLPRR